MDIRRRIGTKCANKTLIRIITHHVSVAKYKSLEKNACLFIYIRENIDYIGNSTSRVVFLAAKQDPKSLFSFDRLSTAIDSEDSNN